jgi:mandelate racemase
MDAIRRIGRLAAYYLTWVEEPVAAEDLEGHVRVRAASSVPVQTSENGGHRRTWRVQLLNPTGA